MTPPAADLTGVALAERCAELMGWIYNDRIGAWDSLKVIDGRTVYRWINEISFGDCFRPDLDHNHAAELRREACKRWPGMMWEIIGPFSDGRTQVRLFDSLQCGRFYGLAVDESECVAICRVFIAACEALGAGG